MMTFRQKFIRFAQITLVVAAFVLFVAPHSLFPSYYRSVFMGITSLIYAFIIQLPVLIFRNPNSKEKIRAREQLQLTLSIGLLLGGLGSLGLWGLYHVGIPYDKVMHFTFSTLMMVYGVALFRTWHGWSLKKTILVLALIIAASGIVWEFIEFFSDRFLHFGYFGHLFDYDSVHDIMFDWLGVAVGTTILTIRQCLNQAK